MPRAPARRPKRRRPAARAPKPRDPLGRILASGALRAVVLYFATHPDATPTLRGLARLTGIGLASVQVEVGRLEALGVLDRSHPGDTRGPAALTLDLAHPAWLALLRLVVATVPIPALCQAAFADLEGVRDAFVFGSVAAGTMHEESDVDVMLVGTPDERALARRTIDVSMLLRRDVNPVDLTPEAWAAAASGFLRHVKRGPKIWLVRDGEPCPLDGETIPVDPGETAASDASVPRTPRPRRRMA